MLTYSVGAPLPRCFASKTEVFLKNSKKTLAYPLRGYVTLPPR